MTERQVRARTLGKIFFIKTFIIKMSLLKWLKPSQNRLVKFGAVTPGLVYCTAKIGVSFWIQTIFNNFFIFSPKMNGSNRTMNSIEASLNLLILSM